MPSVILPIPMTGGVNLLADETRIRDDELVRCKNVVPIRAGLMAKRPATLLRTQLTSSGQPVSFLVPPFNTQIESIIASRRVASGATTKLEARDAAGNGVQADFGVMTQHRPALMPWRERTYAFGGAGATDPALVAYPDPAAAYGISIAAVTFLGTGNNSMRPKIGAMYRNRMVVANFDGIPGGRQVFTMSDRLNASTVNPTFFNGALAAVGPSFAVGGETGDEIVAMQEIMLHATGSPVESALLVLLNYSSWLVTGEILQTADTGDVVGDLSIQRMNVDAGCASRETLTSTPFGWIWAGHDDVWLFPPGTMPIRLGTKIRPALERTPANLRYLWSGAYFDGFYRLAVFGDDNQANNDDASCQHQWWLDLRDGPPQSAMDAKWYGPMTFKSSDSVNGLVYAGTRNLSRDTRPGKPQGLFGCEMLQGDGVGFPSIVRYPAMSEGTGGSLDADNNTSTDPINHDAAQFMDVDVLTKSYDFGDAMLDKTEVGSELSIWVAGNARISVNCIIDGGLVVDPTPALSPGAGPYVDIPGQGFQLDVSQLDAQQLARVFAKYFLSGDVTSRRVGAYYQYRLYDTAGYIAISGDSDTIVYVHNGVTFISTIPAGVYTAATLLQMLAITISAATGAAFSQNWGGAPPLPANAAITSGGLNWGFKFSTGTAAQQYSCRKIAAWLGYNTAADQTPGVTQTAATSAYMAPRQALEFGGLNARVSVSPRRPS